MAENRESTERLAAIGERVDEFRETAFSEQSWIFDDIHWLLMAVGELLRIGDSWNVAVGDEMRAALSTLETPDE